MSCELTPFFLKKKKTDQIKLGKNLVWINVFTQENIEISKFLYGHNDYSQFSMIID